MLLPGDWFPVAIIFATVDLSANPFYYTIISIFEENHVTEIIVN